MHKIRILHVSDLHFRSAEGSLPAERIEQVRREAWRRNRVIGDAFHEEIKYAAQTEPIDIICFTGDVADWGLPQEYDAATTFFTQMAAAAGIPFDRLFFVPGNHDISRNVCSSSWVRLREAAQAVTEHSLSDWMTGGPPPFGVEAGLRNDVISRQHNYREWLRRIDRSDLSPEKSAHGLLGYRVALTIDHLPFPVHVIGLDSAWLAGDDNDNGKLRLTNDQIGRLATDTEGRRLEGFRLALLHHPLSQLADASESRRILGDYADLVLRGHQHEPLADVWSDPDRGLIELAAGCLYEGYEGHRFPNGYTLIDVTTDGRGRPLRHELLFRTWSPRGHWHDDSSLYRSTVNGRMVLSPPGSDIARQPLRIAASLWSALDEQYAACRAARIPVHTFHKFLLVMRIAPGYVAAVFGTLGSSVAQRIETWLRRQSEKHALQCAQEPSRPQALADDRTLAAARAIAAAECSAEVDVRHFFIAILRDEESNTIKELRKTLDRLRPQGFAAMQAAAMKLRPDGKPSDVSTLDLSGDD